jgi:histidine triad (HIT) family protein
MASIFSRIVAGEIPAYKIAENEQFLAFLDAFPIAKGHVLIIPKKETDYLFDLTGEEYISLLLFAKQIAPALQKAIPCLRIGMSVIGLEVPHVHVHLIPLNSMKDADFSKKIQLSKEEFEEIAEAIKANL